MKRLAAMAAQVLWFLLTPTVAFSYLIPLPPLVAAASGSNIAAPPPALLAAPRPGCPSMCGNVTIPYPFGIGVECAWPGLGITITCNHSYSPPRPYAGDFEIISISLEAGEMRVFSPVSYICYNSSNTTDSNGARQVVLDFEPLLISPTRNVFTGIGCATLALLAGREDRSYYTGCYTSCMSLLAAAKDDEECTGLGCCQMSIPTNLSTIDMSWGITSSYTPPNLAWGYSPCNYAFIVEKGRYHFKQRDLITHVANKTLSDRFGDRTIPMVLDWAIRDGGSCPAPSKDAGAPTAPACNSTNSFCVNAAQGPGYLCNCSKGYTGNPYVTDGCTNINECDLRKSNPEKYEKQYPCYSGSTCHDTQGGYKCKCKFGLKGDGKSEIGCQPIFPAWAISILVIIVVAVVATFAIFEVKRRKHRRFFDRNGGDILKSMGINIFTEGQLKKITNGYKKSIGEGAFGKVYIGMTDDSQQVAVKCSTAKGDVLPQQEFVNEITFQFRISHTNLVRLVGCCLETDVPMLVFEFVPRGSLHSVLHGAGKTLPLSMPVRLDIAIGSAEALAYMHSHGGHNHVHGDIKSGNILLDDNLTPKVSDFGSAKLVSVASRYSKWCVSGDMSYIDPIYIKSGRFTEKSDVYSFGVVLLELVTRKPAKYGDNSLYIDFIRSFKEEGNGRKLYDEDILSGDDDARSHHHMECLDRISRLAVRCLKEDVDERPTMAEVVEELKEVKAIASGGSSSVAS